MYFIDTDVLIDVQRGHPPAVAWFIGLADYPAVAGFVVMELIQDARNAHEVGKALRLVAPLAVVWPSEAACARALSDFTAYHLSHGLGLLDALISSCAVSHSATLYTFNSKHYQIVQGLVIEEPYVR